MRELEPSRKIEAVRGQCAARLSWPPGIKAKFAKIKPRLQLKPLGAPFSSRPRSPPRVFRNPHIVANGFARCLNFVLPSAASADMQKQEQKSPARDEIIMRQRAAKEMEKLAAHMAFIAPDAAIGGPTGPAYQNLALRLPSSGQANKIIRDFPPLRRLDPCGTKENSKPQP